MILVLTVVMCQDPRQCASDDGHLSVPRSASSLTSESERGGGEVSRQVELQHFYSTFIYRPGHSPSANTTSRLTIKPVNIFLA